MSMNGVRHVTILLWMVILASGCTRIETHHDSGRNRGLRHSAPAPEAARVASPQMAKGNVLQAPEQGVVAQSGRARAAEVEDKQDQSSVAVTKAEAGIPAPALASARTFDDELVDDLLIQLEKMLPPAHTTLILASAAKDAFGQRLVAALRLRGYGVKESVPGKRFFGKRKSAPEPNEFWYLKDNLTSDALIRVEAGQGSHRLSRLYIVTDGKIFAAGAWAYRE